MLKECNIKEEKGHNVKEEFEKSKLITLLKQFKRKSERERLRDFLMSPFFFKRKEKDPTYLLLFALLDCNGKYGRLHKRALYRRLFGATYNDNKMKKVMTNALQMVERFIAHRTFEENEVQRDIVVAQYYEKSKLESHFNTIKRRIVEKLDTKAEDGGLDKNDFYQLFLLENIIAFFEQKKNALAIEPFRKIIKKLDHFYLTARLKDSCKILVQQRRAKDSRDLSQDDPMIKLLKWGDNYLEKPAIYTYYNVFLAFKYEDKTDDCILLLTDMLEGKLSLDLKTDIFLFLTNILIGKINQGQYHYRKNLFNLYKVSAEQKLVYDDDGKKLSNQHVKNIVTTALQVNKVSWAKNFLKKYEACIDKNVALYNNANIHFHLGDYNHGYQLLSEYIDNDKGRNSHLLFYKVATRRLVIQTFYDAIQKKYEIDNINTKHIYVPYEGNDRKTRETTPTNKQKYDFFDYLEPAMDSFKSFIQRQKGALSEEKCNRNMRFIQILKRIYSLYEYGQTEKHQRLKEEISNDKTIFEQEWLLKKLKEKTK